MTDEHFSERSRHSTIMDVARASGVSYSTVSRVLNDYPFVKPATRERVLQAAERLGYVANLSARSLAGGRSNIIGLLVPELDNGYIGEIVRGIDEELAYGNYDLMLYTMHRSGGEAQQYVKTITNGLADGLLLIVPMVPSEFLEALPRADFPYVLIDQADAVPERTIVDATNWQGAYEATCYLITQGHRDIGFITGDMRLRAAVDRLEGYRAALTDHNLAYDARLIEHGDFKMPSGVHAAEHLLDRAPHISAIFVSNDMMAIGVMETLHKRGLHIPNDMSIIGFDDIPQASLVYPKLTTVRQPLNQMGRVAARLLLERISNPDQPARRVTLATELIVRDSVVLLDR